MISFVVKCTGLPPWLKTGKYDTSKNNISHSTFF